MAESSRSTDQSLEINEEDSGITMLDVLEEEQELEEDAKAVLGGSDDQNCTYEQGYVKRQALYACMTCTPVVEEDFKPAGVCLACSYHCHEGHELVELYTKRNFRCDCGNSKFASNKCNLEQGKSSENELNRYNQNFRGLYCTCHRPYPDPEDQIDDEMMQCIICEDWFHGRHLGTPVPAQHNYGEMTCELCMQKYKFLWNYTGIAVAKVQNAETTKVTNVSDDGTKDKQEEKATDDSVQVSTIKAHSSNSSESGTDISDCKLKKTKPLYNGEGAIFWPNMWRKLLCSCDSCKELYKSEEVSYLLDEKDTVQMYEEAGKAKTGADQTSQYEKGMNALPTLLSSMDRVKQIEAIQEYNNMKVHLKEYLQRFADSKKVVREEDIREFFSEMEARKKQRLQVQIPHFCR